MKFDNALVNLKSSMHFGRFETALSFLFVMHFVLYDKKLLINVDEVGFGRSIKEHYSWLPKGKSSIITNDIFTGRVNIILGVTINEDYLGIMTRRTVNSEDYCLYLTLLSKSLKGTENGIHNDITVIQDNASIHHTNIIKITASREKFTMYYCPSTFQI